jgi:hypothetical protein
MCGRLQAHHAFVERMPTAGRCARIATMIKGATKRASWTAFVVLALGCGGRAENQVSASVGGSDAAGGSPGIAVAGSSAAGAPSIHDEIGGDGPPAPGVGPIDPTGLPTQLPIDCPNMTSPPQLALPCKVGGSLNGGADGPGSYNVLECYDLAGETAAPSGQDRSMLAIIIPFGNLPMMLNQPIQLASFPPAPPPGSGGLTGSLVITQVDPVGRAFVGRLIGGKICVCTIPDTPFWAVKGDFT